MSTLTIQGAPDIAKGRNLLRQLILGQRWSPTLCARAVAAFGVLGELIVGSNETGTLDILIVPLGGKPGVELKCNISLRGAEQLPIETMHSLLTRAADVVDIRECGDQLAITAYLWRDKSA